MKTKPSALSRDPGSHAEPWCPVLARLTSLCILAQSVQIPGQCLVKAQDMVPRVGLNLPGNGRGLVGSLTVSLPGNASVFLHLGELF